MRGNGRNTESREGAHRYTWASEHDPNLHPSGVSRFLTRVPLSRRQRGETLVLL